MIEQVSNARYLGVVFDDKLNFEEQFKRIKSKMVNGVKALMCIRQTLNYRAKLLLYNGSIKSHIEYCSVTFLDKFSKKQINELYRLQKQAVRLIFNAKKNVHTEKLFKLTGILPITKMYDFEAIKMVYKNKYEPLSNTQPLAIKDLLIPHNHDSIRLYHDQNNIKIPDYYKKNHCFYNMINVWNNSSGEARMAGNIWSLKRSLKSELTQSLQPCVIRNCKICQIDENRDYQKYMQL